MSSRNCTCQPRSFTRSESLRATSNASPVLAVRLTRKPRTPLSARCCSSLSVMSSPISAMPRSRVRIGLDRIDDETIVVAVEPGLHQHAALEPDRAVHGEIILQEHRRRRVEPRGRVGILVLRPEHMRVAVHGLRRQLQRRLAHVEQRSGAHRRFGGAHGCSPSTQDFLKQRRLLRFTVILEGEAALEARRVEGCTAPTTSVTLRPARAMSAHPLLKGRG